MNELRQILCLAPHLGVREDFVDIRKELSKFFCFPFAIGKNCLLLRLSLLVSIARIDGICTKIILKGGSAESNRECC